MYIDPWVLLAAIGIYAGITFIWRRIRKAYAETKTPDKPMAVKLETEKTPRQVMAEASKAALSCGIWSTVLVVVIAAMIVFVLWLLGV